MAGITFTFERVADDGHWHSTRSAKILVDGRDVGRIGQVASKYTQAFGIDKDVMCAMLDFQTLVHGMEVTRRYEPIPEFPGIDRDIAVIVDAGLAYGDLVVAVEGADELIRSVKLVEVYRGKGIDEGKKSVTLSMHLRSDSKTLESQDADGAMGRVEAILTGQFSGIIR